jgi:hypothetical protein
LPASLITVSTPSLLAGAGQIGAATLGGQAISEAALQGGIKAAGTEALKGFGMKEAAALAIAELTPFGDIMEGGLTKETASKTAVKMAAGEMKKEKSVPTLPDVSINNSVSTQAPDIQESTPAKKTGSEKKALSPEQMMQLVQMMRQQQAQGVSRPIARGRYY